MEADPPKHPHDVISEFFRKALAEERIDACQPRWVSSLHSWLRDVQGQVNMDLARALERPQKGETVHVVVVKLRHARMPVAFSSTKVCIEDYPHIGTCDAGVNGARCGRPVYETPHGPTCGLHGGAPYTSTSEGP